MIARRPLGPPPLVLRLAAVLAVPLVLYALVATGQKALDNYRLNQDAEALRAEIHALRAENVELQGQIEDARSDAAIETIAREQLGLVKPGDKPLVVLSDGPSSPPRALEMPPPAPTPPTWRQWLDVFFD